MDNFKIAMFVLLAIAASESLHAHAQPSDVCPTAYEKSEQDKIAIPADTSVRTVTGAGRLYFHIAPDERCRYKNVFVVPNDRLEVFAQYGEFTEVIYWNPVSGTGIAGWVSSSRLAEPVSLLGMARTGRDF